MNPVTANAVDKRENSAGSTYKRGITKTTHTKQERCTREDGVMPKTTASSRGSSQAAARSGGSSQAAASSGGSSQAAARSGGSSQAARSEGTAFDS